MNPRPPARSAAPRGFTLIEAIAVLGIISILASVVGANVITRLRNSARTAETVNLDTLQDALRAGILRRKQVPAPADWPALIARELALPQQRVATTAAGYSRSFVSDPDLDLGRAALPASSRKLPYTQGVGGSVEPVALRGLIVSTLGATLPSIPTNSTAFTELWATPAGSRPASWTSWQGLGEDLWIRRLDLGGLFHRVILNNLDPLNQAPYSVDSLTNLTLIAPGQRVEAFFLSTTSINLHFASQALQASEFLRTDISYVFENGRWTRYLNYGVRPPLSGFGLLAEDFRLSPQPPGAKFGASPQAAIEEFFSFLYAYGQWAIGDAEAAPFSVGGSTSAQQYPEFQVVNDAQKRLEIVTGNLID